ncbi:PKD domain-containing protein [Olleya sp. ITB9]|uniref:PKD domain-containing protein n=1 Tax=Olleya sp. ITB9 TaxID=1715648 RepID=UPI0006D276EF|nr:PKD domain-containing protein [Olleya sp. ITB9]
MKNYFFLLLILISSTGNIKAQNKKENININSCQLTSNFSYYKSNCDTVVFNANPSSNTTTTILGYFWDFGDGTNSTLQNPTHSYSSNGNYSVRLTVVGFNNTTGDCCNDVTTKTLNINCIEPCGNVNSITQLNLLGNENVKFFIPNGSLIINSGWSNPTYFWQFTCQSTGYYTWSYDEQPYVDLSNCSGFWEVTATVTVTDSQGNQCSFSRTEDLHPGGTGGFSKISINPLKDTLNIEIDKNLINKNAKTEILVFNMNGEIKEKISLNKNEKTSLNVRKLKPGIYILKLLRNGKITDTKKVVISN